MAQGNRRDEKMRSDRGEWDRKRTGSGNTDKRKKNRSSSASFVYQKSQRNRQYVIRLRNGQRGCVRAGD